MRKIILITVGFGIVGMLLSECKSSKTATTTTTVAPAPAPSKANPYMPTDEMAKAHGVALADLNKGRDLFIGSCDKCHKLPSPSKHDMAGWENTMKAMGPKAHLSNSDATMVVQYLASSK